MLSSLIKLGTPRNVVVKSLFCGDLPVNSFSFFIKKQHRRQNLNKLENQPISCLIKSYPEAEPLIHIDKQKAFRKHRVINYNNLLLEDKPKIQEGIANSLLISNSIRSISGQYDNQFQGSAIGFRKKKIEYSISKIFYILNFKNTQQIDSSQLKMIVCRRYWQFYSSIEMPKQAFTPGQFYSVKRFIPIYYFLQNKNVGRSIFFQPCSIRYPYPYQRRLQVKDCQMPIVVGINDLISQQPGMEWIKSKMSNQSQTINQIKNYYR